MGELLAAVDIMELPDLPPETKESKKKMTRIRKNLQDLRQAGAVR